MQFLIVGGVFVLLFVLLKNTGFGSDVKNKIIGSLNAPGRATYDEYIQNAANKTGLSTALIKAFIKKESSWNPRAYNPEGSYGLMQIGMMTAQDEGLVKDWRHPTAAEVEAVFKPENNIMAGASHFADLLSRYNFDTAVQMYNTGETKYLKGARVPYYLRKIKEFFNEYSITG